MRGLRLAGLAVRAERLRLRRLVRRLAVGAALAAVAALFAVLTLVAVEVALVFELAARMPASRAVLWVAGGDAVLALGFGWLASRAMRPGAAEREARAVRERALSPLRDLAAAARLALGAERLWLRLVLAVLRRPERRH